MDQRPGLNVERLILWNIGAIIKILFKVHCIIHPHMAVPYIMAVCILMMLHPFIPFFTEKMWLDLKLHTKLKTPLINKNWTLPTRANLSFKKSYKKIDWIIQLITNIRSTKVDLEILPGSFIDVSIEDLKKDKKDIINDNLGMFKSLGRVSNVYYSKRDKNGINIIIGVDTVTLYFSNEVNLLDQKQKISKKVKDLDNKIFSLTKKLENKSFLKNAPKAIIQKEKNLLLQY